MVTVDGLTTAHVLTPRHYPSAAPCRPLRRSRAAPCKPFPGIFVRDARTVTTSCFSECSRPAQKPTNSSRMTPKKLKNTQTKSGRSRNSETWMTHSSSTSHIPRVSECRKAVQGLAKVCIANVNICTGRLSKDRYLDFGSAKIQNSIVASVESCSLRQDYCPETSLRFCVDGPVRFFRGGLNEAKC